MKRQRVSTSRAAGMTACISPAERRTGGRARQGASSTALDAAGLERHLRAYRMAQDRRRVGLPARRGGDWRYRPAARRSHPATRLERYALPDPPGPDGVREAVRRSLGFLSATGPAQGWPLLAPVFLAPLASLVAADFAVWVAGRTGRQKSTCAALALRHYGDFPRTCLPANFTSTGNALELLAFYAKDALLVVDDFAPAPDAKMAANQEAAAFRLLRAVGDTHGRNRATRDARLQGE